MATSVLQDCGYSTSSTLSEPPSVLHTPDGSFLQTELELDVMVLDDDEDTSKEATRAETNTTGSPNKRRKIELSETSPARKRASSGTPKAAFIPRQFPIDPALNQQAPKPAPIGKPRAWAEHRHELCETFPWYRSYQAGTYQNSNTAYGTLIDGTPSERDIITSKVVISHGGGAQKQDKSGAWVMIRDHAGTDLAISALISSMHKKVPIGLIFGSKAKHLPTAIPHRYCVADFFKITHSWNEPCTGSEYHRIKFRYEKLNFDEDGWWAAAPSNVESEEVVEACCASCRISSPQIYTSRWVCLRKECSEYWGGEARLNKDELEHYAPSFINGRTVWDESLQSPPYELIPKPIEEASSSRYELLRTIGWRGRVCGACGRCMCRVFMDAWHCGTCRTKTSVQIDPFTHENLANLSSFKFSGPAFPTDEASAEIMANRTVKDGLSFTEYLLGRSGSVFHVQPNSAINRMPGHANDLLKGYQTSGAPLRRRIMQVAGGQGLTSHYSFNAGATYNYHVAQDATVPFNEAPEVVLQSLQLIKETVEIGIGKMEQDFNEILSVGYLEKQKMSWHDDGEVGLGPVVASLSLGSEGKMQFRLKDQNKLRNRGICKTEAELLEAPTDAAQRGFVPGGTKIKPKVKLQLTLNHGDVVIMNGADIHREWDHMVANEGLLRFAATARYICEEKNAHERTKARKRPNKQRPQPEPVGSSLLPRSPIFAKDDLYLLPSLALGPRHRRDKEVLRSAEAPF